jgi:hypothetical protein
MNVDWLSEGTEVFLFTMPKPVVRPNQPSIHWVLWVPSPTYIMVRA